MPNLCWLVLGACFTAGAGVADQSPPQPKKEQGEISEKKVDPKAAARYAVAAMPDGAESVIVMDYAALRREGSKYKDLVQIIVDQAAQSVDVPEADPVERLKGSVLPLVRLEAMGGSHFTVPRNLGIGHYNSRTILITSESLEPIKARVRKGDLGNWVEVEGSQGAIWSTQTQWPAMSEPRNTILMAFVSETVVILAPDRQDIDQMTKRIKASEQEVPVRWKPAADDATLAAPIFVLRAFDASRKDETWRLAKPLARDEKAPHLLRLVVPRADTVRIEARAWTTEKQKTRHFIGSVGGDWEFADVADGVTAVETFPGREEGPHYILLGVLSLFGPPIFI